MNKSQKVRGPSAQIIGRVRQLGATSEEWAANIDKQLLNILREKFSTKETKQFATWRSQPITPAGMLEKLDTIILIQAGTLGWRLGLSPIVQRRFSDWDYSPHGPARFKELGQAFSRSARIFQGLELPPIDDPGLYLQKRETVRELRTLQRKISDRFRGASSLNQRAHLTRLVGYFMNSICDESEGFQQLSGDGENAFRWFAFLQCEENLLALGKFASRDRAQRMTAVTFFEQWLAWCKGAARGKPFDQTTLRKRISALGKSFRS